MTAAYQSNPPLFSYRTMNRTVKIICFIIAAVLLLQSPYAVYTFERAFVEHTSKFFLTKTYNVVYLVGLRVVVEFLLPFIISCSFIQSFNILPVLGNFKAKFIKPNDVLIDFIRNRYKNTNSTLFKSNGKPIKLI